MTRKARLSAASAASVLLLSLSITPAWAQSGTVAYTYDSLGRVVDAAYPDGTCLAYSYDAAGNRTQYTASTVVSVVAPAVSVTAYEALAATFDPRVGNPTCSALTVSAVGTPAHGTATILTGGAGIVYTPAAGYTGSDSFTYKVTSGGTSSPNGTVTVTVLAPTLAPVALAGAGTFTGYAPVTPVVTTNVAPLISDPYGYTPTVSAVTQGSQGSVAYAGDEITYTYGQEVAGQHAYFDSYTYTVTDGHGNTATATVSIKMVVLNPG
jgi:YD repeat-containing protein